MKRDSSRLKKLISFLTRFLRDYGRKILARALEARGTSGCAIPGWSNRQTVLLTRSVEKDSTDPDQTSPE